MEATKRRIRRTAEQRLADFERKQAEIMERQRAALAKLEEAKKKILETPAVRKANREREKRFQRAAQTLAAGWDYRHYIAAIEKALHEGVPSENGI